MSRRFNGSSQFLQSSATVDLSTFNKFTVALWLWWDSFSNNDNLAMEHGTNYNSQTDGWLIDPNSSVGGSGVFQCALRGDVGYSDFTFTRPSVNVWHHYVVLFDKSVSTNETTVYLDGAVPAGANRPNNNNNTNNFGNLTLNFMGRNGASLFGQGRMQEVAIWPGILLDVQEIEALGLRGFAPPMVRRTSLGWYWPLLGRTNPEIELRQGNNATVTGAVVEDHYRVLYPDANFGTQPPPPVVGGPTTVFRRTLSALGTRVGSRQVVGT